MYLPPNYGYPQPYPQPPYQPYQPPYQPYQPSYQPYQPRPTHPLTPGMINPPPPIYPQYPINQQYKRDEETEEKKKFMPNIEYVKSTLGIIRGLLILSLIATVIAAAMVVNRDWEFRRESSYDVSVWLSTLVFACIELALCILIYLINIVGLPKMFVERIWLIAFALFDLFWVPSMIILGAFCAKRENDNHPDFRNMSLNQGAFGVTSAFSLLTAFLFLASAIVGISSAFGAT